MNNNTEDTTPIAKFELVTIDTNRLSINDATLAEAVAILKPIADGIPGIIERAKSLTVANAADAADAAILRDMILAEHKKAYNTITEFDGGIIDKLHKLHRRWTALRGAFAPLESAAKQIKGKIIEWQESERKKAEAEQARLQAEADERARKERERLEKEAAKLKSPEKIQERLDAAASVVAPIVRVAAPTAAVKVQRRWVVAMVDKQKFFAAAAQQQMLQGFITVNESALARAKAANPMMEIEGVTFEQRAI